MGSVFLCAMASSPRRARRFLYALVILAVALPVVVSAALAVPPGDRGKPARTTSQPAAASDNPAKKCRAERSEKGAAAFATRHGTNANERNAFGKCVSSQAKKPTDDDEDEETAKDESEEKTDNAAKKCKAERASMGDAAFGAKHGTNANKRNAFGKCVSKYAKEQAKKRSG